MTHVLGERWIAAAALVVLAPLVSADTLNVGDGQPFARPEEALAKARAGDEIVLHPHKDGSPYAKVALLVRTPRVTIRSADAAHAVVLSGAGFEYSGRGAVPRAIVQFDPGAEGCVLENLELTAARNESFNGAGVRINQANNVTIRGCRIHHNDMGVMSNGELAAKTGANQLIEGCVITDNGTAKQPGQNHNLYLGGSSVTVRGCEIARSLTGHNLKSRAHFNWIEYNYLHDSANRELDLVDAAGNTDVPDSHAVLLGNFIVKKRGITGNKAVIHFGKDGKAAHDGTIYLAHNTIVTPYVSPVVDLSGGRGAVFLNNRIEDGGALQAGVLISSRRTGASFSGAGNALPAGFLAALPQSVQQGDAVPWEQLKLPWQGKAAEHLLEYRAAGELRIRSDPGSAGAGTSPR